MGGARETSSIVLKLPTTFLMIVIGLSPIGWRSSGAREKVGSDWTTVKRGEITGPIEFTKQGLMEYRKGDCRLEIIQEDETTTEVQFSPISPSGEYQVLIADAYDFEPGYLVDIKRCGVQHLPFPRYVLPWVSWSPDATKALFYTDYEASPQLWVLDVQSGLTFEIHRTKIMPRSDTCCGLNEWAGKAGVGYLVPESVKWSGDSSFGFRLEISCNPYSEAGGWPCDAGDNEHPRAAYRVSVDMKSATVTSGPRITLPVRKTP